MKLRATQTMLFSFSFTKESSAIIVKATSDHLKSELSLKSDALNDIFLEIKDFIPSKYRKVKLNGTVILDVTADNIIVSTVLKVSFSGLRKHMSQIDLFGDKLNKIFTAIIISSINEFAAKQAT